MLKLKIIRIKKGIRQNELAARLGMRQATLSDIENGKVKNPRKRTLQRIADALGIPITRLKKFAA